MELKMKKKLVALFLTAHILLFFGCSSRNDTAVTPQFDTDKYIGAWVSMWNTYDLNQVHKLFLNDPGITYFSSEKEGVVQGFDAVIEHHRGFGFVEGGNDTGNKLWVDDLTTQA